MSSDFKNMDMSMRSLNNIKMNVISTAETGVVNEQTIFSFSQRGNIVSATYAGGEITIGYLVGTLINEILTFSYCQIQTDGKHDSGNSNCELIIDEDGKQRLIEHFEWGSRGGVKGVNVFKEL